MTEPISRPSTAEYSKDTSGNLTQESNLIHWGYQYISPKA